MNKKYFALAIAAIALVGCTYDYGEGDIPLEIAEEPEITYEGSGVLVYEDEDGNEVTTASTYSWTAADDAININIAVDLDEYAETGNYEIGHFTLSSASICDFLEVSSLEDDVYPNMVALDPDGTEVDWSSYAPGMWVDLDGVTSNWSSGYFYWQWYICSESSYDYDYSTHKNIIMVGGSPSNTPKIAGSTITSKAKITLGDRVVSFVVTATFTGSGSSSSDEEQEPEAATDYAEYIAADGNTYAYQSAASGDHSYTWIMDSEGIKVNVDTYIPSIDDWGYLNIIIDPDVMVEYLGIESIDQLADLTYFYPVDSNGTPGEEWTSYEPGQWVDSNGDPADWSSGTLYWQYQFGDNHYEGHYSEGLLVIGTNPDNVADLDGTSVTSKAVIGDKTFEVTVNYHANMLTSKEGQIGPNSYAWNIGEDAMTVTANVSLASLDDSWGIMSFVINEAYVNDAYDITIDDLTIEDFYPVDPDGNPYEDWSSYEPGEWFAADGSEANWSTGVAFWQYYTHTEYDYALPNLFYLGKNPDNALGTEDASDSSLAYKVGDTYVSKAKLAGRDFIVTINIVD